MKLTVMLLALSFNVFAQDITRQQAENEHFRDFTRAEFMQKLGADAALLPQYACNGANEMDPFWPGIRHNEKKDSLKIQLYKQEVFLTYKEGKYFDASGDLTSDLGDVFVAYVVEAMKKIEATPEGQKMLRELERGYYPVTIKFGGNAFNPRNAKGEGYRGLFEANAMSILNHGRMSDEPTLEFSKIGAGGSIGWNPNTKDIPPHIALAHEMFHALDSVRGILDMRFVDAEGYENSFVSEFRAVYFENIMRKAAGVEYRTHYSGDEGPGVLDPNGEPRYISSPCLKN